MHKLLRRSVGLAYLMLAPLALGAGPARLDASMQAQIDAVVEQELASQTTPSVSLAIVVDGKIAYVKAYGQARIEPPRRAAVGMRYGIGSISKQFLATAMLMLQQDGRLSLDDEAGKYIANLGPAGKVTLRQLLSHTAGIRDYFPQDYVPASFLKPIGHEELLDRWARQPLDFPPGERWQYSNTGYVLAGMAVEKVSGESLDALMQRRIFMPLGIGSAIDIDTGYLDPADATGYTRTGLEPLRPAPKIAAGWMYSTAELAMTAEDLAKWDVSLMTRSLLTPASYRAMQTEALLNNGVGTRYGLGLGVRLDSERRLLSHTGSISGFLARNLVYPDERVAIVVLTNTDAGGAAPGIAGKLSKLIFATSSQEDASRTALDRQILADLVGGTLRRERFTNNGSESLTTSVVEESHKVLAAAGELRSFNVTFKSFRGGMDERWYKATFDKGVYVIVTRAWPDGLLEQYMLSPE